MDLSFEDQVGPLEAILAFTGRPELTISASFPRDMKICNGGVFVLVRRLPFVYFRSVLSIKLMSVIEIVVDDRKNFNALSLSLPDFLDSTAKMQ